MNTLRNLLIAFVAVISLYTVWVVSRFGVDLITPYLQNLASGTWAGQITLDFTLYLLLSATWVAWRHRGGAAGFGLAALAASCGMLFFAPYMLWACARAKGDPRALLLGAQRLGA